MANTTILLRQDIESVGGRGEIVKVKAGYARNYLLPQGLASLATKGNVKQIDQERTDIPRHRQPGQRPRQGVEIGLGIAFGDRLGAVLHGRAR